MFLSGEDVQNAVQNDFYASGHTMYCKFRSHNADWKHVDMCKDNSLKTKKNRGKQCTELSNVKINVRGEKTEFNK